MPKYCALSKKAEEIKASLKPIGAELKKLYDVKDKCKAKIDAYTKKFEGFFNSRKMLKTETTNSRKKGVLSMRKLLNSRKMLSMLGTSFIRREINTMSNKDKS